MTQLTRSSVTTLALLFGVVSSAGAQRGRGPSEEITSRYGSYFVDVKLPAPVDKKPIALETCSLVQSSVKDGHLSFLYLYDPTREPVKHGPFEQIIFGHYDITLSLRLFRCGRVNLAEDEKAKAEFGNRAPLFVAFNGKGKWVGDVSMHDYAARSDPIVDLLTRAASGHTRLSRSEFVIKYREFLREYGVYEGRKKSADDRRSRLNMEKQPDKAKLNEIERDLQELEKNKDKLLETEKQILDLAKVPPRDGNAVRLGDRDQGRGGR
jgi:hypothetical protein